MKNAKKSLYRIGMDKYLRSEAVWTEAPIHRVQGEHSSWPAVASRCFEMLRARQRPWQLLSAECKQSAKCKQIRGASSSSKCSSKPLPSHSENPLVQFVLCISDLFPSLVVSLETSVAIWRCSLSISARCFQWQDHLVYEKFLLVKSNLVLPKESARLLHGHVLMKCLHSFQFQAVSLRDSQSNQQLLQ